ncbi:hypothetical protein [Neochlamydia sp. S13]|uniref:hypothetical protein n=1 Tax=Neochlamydia sp. S13 TaxID=1353976 RepID=UPI0006947980|nr:hypothetical protein [Neochlamydia sp. S13]BBI17444.1 Putative uncharacterized protein [Neochlamydia sp. S13]
MRTICLVLFLYVLGGCSKNAYLSVQSSYFTKESLASYRVGTPDPMLANPPVEQQLLISWSIPYPYLKSENLHLDIYIQLRNKEQVKLTLPLKKSHGSYLYVLANERYFNTKGILTYKVDLIADGRVVEEWRHHLWHEIIRVGEDESN